MLALQRSKTSSRLVLVARVVPVDDGPLLADNGYPSEAELDRIRQWPSDTFEDLAALWQYVLARWTNGWWSASKQRHRDYPKKIYAPPGGTLKRRYWISTGGWSGNESLIHALGEHRLFWMVCWYSSRVGGHYEFRVPE